MLCKIADLIVDIPSADGLEEHCREYGYTGTDTPVLTIDPTRYRREAYPGGIIRASLAYMESAHQFYMQLPNFQGFCMHASAVILDGKAYLFSGQCGAGKSTHARLWCSTFPGAVILNDDKVVLRCIDGVWYAYGTPWCGTEGIHRNAKAPVAGVCFMEQANHNAIHRLTPAQALQPVLAQTLYKFGQPEQLDPMLTLLDRFLQTVPVFRLENRPESAAAILSKETMEMGCCKMRELPDRTRRGDDSSPAGGQ